MAEKAPDEIAKKLSLREGKVLRNIVSTQEQPVSPDRVVNSIEWSDLPHSILEAKATFSSLRKLKLIKRQGEPGNYTFTQLGQKVIAYADSRKMWRKPPPPEVTGVSTFKADPKKAGATKKNWQPKKKRKSTRRTTK